MIGQNFLNLMIPSVSHYWLQNAQVPACLLAGVSPSVLAQQNQEGLVSVHLEILSGGITQILPAIPMHVGETPVVNCQGKQVWPWFIDCHTHLDKGHIWSRAPNPDGTFDSALKTAIEDSQNWHPEDLYRRMEFGLKCSYAHGTQAIRTHLDSTGSLAQTSWDVFQTLQYQWQDRITLQAVSLVPLADFLTPMGEKLADRVAECQGILGGVAYMNPEIDRQLDRVFTLAKERQLDLDFHTDENGDPESITLRKVAKAAIRHDFSGQIVCGHCCSLAVQSPETGEHTLQLVKQAGIGIISLPLCNLYLQDRQYTGATTVVHLNDQPITPVWRGITRLHEIKRQGIPLAIASDNCRDPFFGFGDHDVLEVFNQGVRIGHLDQPYGDWPQIVTQTPADLMKLPKIGKISLGNAADLIIFKGRSFSELLARPQADRFLLRKGKLIHSLLPDYQELDDLMNHP